MERCYAVILNYKNWEESLECIRNLFASDYACLTAIVVDNNSQNNSLSKIEAELKSDPVIRNGADHPVVSVFYEENDFLDSDPAQYPDLVLVQSKTNGGFAAGNNIALRLLLNTKSYIWMLNPDMIVDRKTLSEMVSAAKASQKLIIGAVTKNFYKPDEILFYGGGRVNPFLGTVSLAKDPADISKIEYISGGCLLMHSTVLSEVRLLPERYFLYWEETDWCYRARSMGFSMEVCLSAFCYDKVSTTIGRGFLSDYYYARNGLLFIRKYRPFSLVFALTMTFVRAVKRLLLGQGRRASGIMKGTIDFLFKKPGHENQ